MQTVHKHYLGHNECPYTLNGVNLATMRRARLRKIAHSLKIDPEGEKNTVLQRIITHLKVSEAPMELSEK